jgi:ribosomal protein S12 methylthiotransferase
MPRPDEDTARGRAEIIEQLQSRIMDDYNKSRVGQRTAVLPEARDGELFLARSYAESPEIDGYIYVAGDDLRIGDIVMANIVDEGDGAVYAEADA